jgi:hypothetical protein
MSQDPVSVAGGPDVLPNPIPEPDPEPPKPDPTPEPSPVPPVPEPAPAFVSSAGERSNQRKTESRKTQMPRYGMKRVQDLPESGPDPETQTEGTPKSN